MALDHVGCLQWALKSVIESQIRQCYAGQMAMQFTNYKHRWENNIGKNTGLDNFSSLCARAFLAALHFLIIKINEPSNNLLLKVMGSLMNKQTFFLLVFSWYIFFPDDSDNVFWGADNSKLWPCSPAHLPRVWPRLPSLNVWTIFSPDFPNALHTRNILVVRASSSSSQAIHQRFTPDCDLSLPYSRHGDIQNIEHEKHQVRVLDSGFRIRLETNYYSWLELLFPLENSA